MSVDVATLDYVAPRRRSRMGLFVSLLVLANLMWAGQPTAVKFIENFLGPLAISFMPFYFVTPLLVPLLFIGRGGTPVGKPTLADWGRFTVAGVGGQILAQVGMTWGSVKGEASTVTILNLLIPVFTALLASVLLRERLTALRIFSLLIGLAGVLLMSAHSLEGGAMFQSRFLQGNLLFLEGCLGAAFYNVYCKGLMARFPERDILIYSYITASLVSLPILFSQEPGSFGKLAAMDWQAWAALIFLALFVYGVSMLMLFYVLQFLPVTITLSSVYLMPIFGVAIALIFLDEQLRGMTVAGAVVVLISTVLIMRYDPAVK